jgi:hypothetical protein
MALDAAFPAGAAAFIFVGAAVGRARLPAGLADGAIIGSVTVGLLTALEPDRGWNGSPARLSNLLVGLAMVWTAAALWLCRRVTVRADSRVSQSTDGSATGGVEQRWRLYAEAAVGCGVAAGILILTHSGGEAHTNVLRIVGLLSLLAACGGYWLVTRSAGAVWCGVAASGAVCHAIGSALGQYRAGSAEAIAVLGAAAAVVLSILVPIGTWLRLRRLWARGEIPNQRRHPAGQLALFGAVLLSCGAGLFFLPALEQPVSLIALTAATIALFTVHHQLRVLSVAPLGFALLLETAVSAVRVASGGGLSAALLGCGVGGLYFCWLARFWEQQLCDGRPWTTTGRLVPTARDAAVAAAVTGAGVAMLNVLAPPEHNSATVWVSTLAALTMLGLALSLLRMAARQNDAAFGGATLAAWLACWLEVRETAWRIGASDAPIWPFLVAAAIAFAALCAPATIRRVFRPTLAGWVGGFGVAAGVVYVVAAAAAL